ncbi:hypothetical protein [Nocardia sp. XZ_19_385]|nr:hypothetical protein [Nocardia sp. XZ_19_385]
MEVDGAGVAQGHCDFLDHWAFAAGDPAMQPAIPGDLEIAAQVDL